MVINISFKTVTKADDLKYIFQQTSKKQIILILNNFFVSRKKKIKDRKPVKYLCICLLIQYLVRLVQNKKLHASKLKCYYFYD